MMSHPFLKWDKVQMGQSPYYLSKNCMLLQHALHIVTSVLAKVLGQFYTISQNWESSCVKMIASGLKIGSII